MGFGLYQALRGTDNWAQKRQDKMQSLMIAKEREQGAQKELKQSMELEQGMQKYFDEMKNLDALAEDQGRINDEEKKARRKIYKGVAAANGNLKAYMSSGGISAMSDYRNSIMNSEAAKNAATNKANLANYAKDRSENKFVKNVTFEVPVMKDGQPTGETKTITRTMDEQYALFQKGVIKKMNYSGAEDKVKIDMFKFADQAKNPNSPYYSANVTTGDYMTYIKSQGGSEEQALTRAKGYADDVAGGMQAWKWGKEDYYADQVKISTINKNSRGGSDKGGSSKTITLNQRFPSLDRLVDSSEGGTMPLAVQEAPIWNKTFGIEKNSGTKASRATRGLKGFDSHSGAEYELSNALDIQLGEFVVKDGKRYISATATFDANNVSPNAPNEEGFFYKNKLVDHEGTKNNWQEIDIDQTNLEIDGVSQIWQGEVFLPIDEYARDPLYIDGYNKKVGITSAQQILSPGANVGDYSNQAFTPEVEVAINDIKARFGVSRDEAIFKYKKGLDRSKRR
jgi:hypothetical protein